MLSEAAITPGGARAEASAAWELASDWSLRIDASAARLKSPRLRLALMPYRVVSS
ncbi:hypothetical protein D3C84_1257440 [compost metagenome]